MKSMHKLSFLLTAGVLLALAGTASATNGYFTHGTGTKNKGMAGAGMAGATDSISIANNPASAVDTGLAGTESSGRSHGLSGWREEERRCAALPLGASAPMAHSGSLSMVAAA